MEAFGVIGRLLAEVPIAVVTTVLAGRLLGVRRSWNALTLAGVIGWTAGNVLQLDLAGSDAVGPSVATAAFSVFFTMLTALALDFTARPGSLARAERAGLIVVPRPLRDLRRRLEPIARYRELLAIARANGLDRAVGLGGRRARGRAAGGEREPLAVALRRTLEQGGVIFVKLGQMASTRADLIPEDIYKELSLLQSQVDAVPPEEMKSHLEAELGGAVEDLFAEFDWEPLGTASIAQAYAARLTTGEPVVVKVQRPGVDDLVARDTAALLQVARMIERRTPQGRDLHVADMAEEFVRSLLRELDFLREAASTDALAAATSPDSGVRIPRIHRSLMTRRVLVEERFVGKSVQHRERVAELGVAPTELADRLVATMVGHILQGDFHADLHPGNVLLLDSGDLGLIDFGSVGHLDPSQRAAILQMTAGFLQRDAAALRDAFAAVAILGEDVNDVALERALAHFLSEHGENVDATALNDVIPLLATFDIQLPGELTTFFRAMVLVDCTCRAIHPGDSVIDAMGRLMHGDGAAAAVPAGTVEEQVKAQLLTERPRLARLPALVERVATQAARGELRGRTALFSTARDARVVSTLVNRLVLGLVGGLILLGSAILVGTSSGPTVSDSTSFAQVFGFVGLGVAGILLLRVVAAIVRDGYN
ncbi:MAG: ABC1 kinase family protein [Acidimicrobiales bacterium]